MVIGTDDFVAERALPGPHSAIDIDVSAPATRWPEGFEVGREVCGEFRPHFHIKVVVPSVFRLPWLSVGAGTTKGKSFFAW